MSQTRVDQRHLAERLFDILGAFSADQPRLGLSDICRRTGLPVATVHRLVGHLAGWGALERGTDGRYGIGLRLWQIARLEHRTLGLRETGRPLLLDLQQCTGATAQLVVLDGDETLVVDQISGVLPVDMRIGDRAPARSSVAGRVLLAHRPVTSASVDPLRRVLDDVRCSGVAVCDGLGGGGFAVAAPVTDADGVVVAALAAVGRAPGRNPRQVIHDVRTTTAALEDALRGARRPTLVS